MWHGIRISKYDTPQMYSTLICASEYGWASHNPCTPRKSATSFWISVMTPNKAVLVFKYDRLVGACLRIEAMKGIFAYCVGAFVFRLAWLPVGT